MNIAKLTIATAAVITCCLGNEMPAKADMTTCMGLGSGMTTCHGSGGMHTIFDMRPKPMDFGGSSITPPSNDMIMCNTMGSMTTCF